MREEFAIRPSSNRYGLDTAIRVKDGNLIVVDPLSRRFCFSLSDPGGPKRVTRYTVIGSRAGGSTDVWTVVDRQGRSFVNATESLWPADEFKQLAKTAGLVFEPFQKSTPEHRPDYVEVSEFRGGTKSLLFYWFVLPVLVCIGMAGLFGGFPWVWPIVFLGWGGSAIATSVQEALTVQRNRSHLPVDEGGLGLPENQPPPPCDLRRAMRERNVPRRAATWGAITVIPPLLTALR
jgi:hypothetical protein